MININQYQYEIMRDGVMEFNHLVVDNEFRKTEDYLLLQYDLVQEEMKEKEGYWEEMHSKIPHLTDIDSYPAPSPSVGYLDGLADTFVTAVQLVDCISPSQLTWDYIQPLLMQEDIPRKLRHTNLGHIIDVIKDAEFYGVDIVGAVCEVNRSNMTKVPTLSEVQEVYGACPVAACEAAAEWIENSLGGDYQITWELVTQPYKEDRVVFKDQFEKVRKWVGYSEPVLQPYLGV